MPRSKETLEETFVAHATASLSPSLSEIQGDTRILEHLRSSHDLRPAAGARCLFVDWPLVFRVALMLFPQKQSWNPHDSSKQSARNSKSWRELSLVLHERQILAVLACLIS